MWHGFVLERSTEIELTFENPYTPTFSEFPELATVTTAFRIYDDVLQEVKKVIIETHRLQLKQRIGKGSYITLERQINNKTVVDSLYMFLFLGNFGNVYKAVLNQRTHVAVKAIQGKCCALSPLFDSPCNTAQLPRFVLLRMTRYCIDLV